MLVCCTSDLHGNLPKIPDCDLLLIGGDLCGPSLPVLQYDFLDGPFRQWVDDLMERDIVVAGIEGNHAILAKRQPETFKELVDSIGWYYIENNTFVLFEGEKVYGVSIAGYPGSLPFGQGWAFNYTEEELEKQYLNIDEGTNIIISHGPPYGYGDITFDGEHVGSKSLLRAIERVKPKLVCTGHLHFGYGVYNIGDTIVVNAAHMDDDYRPVNKPILVEI